MNTALVVSSEQVKANRELAIQKAREVSRQAGYNHMYVVGKAVKAATAETAHQTHRAAVAGSQYVVGGYHGFLAGFKAE
jgi:formiminotetrahydrofolate cyclodeaminase